MKHEIDNRHWSIRTGQYYTLTERNCRLQVRLWLVTGVNKQTVIVPEILKMCFIATWNAWNLMVQRSDHIVDLIMTPGPHDLRIFHNNHPFIPFPIFLVACVRGLLHWLYPPYLPVVRGPSPSQQSAAAPDTCYSSHLVSPASNILHNFHQVSIQPVVQSSCSLLDICSEAVMLESCIQSSLLDC